MLYIAGRDVKIHGGAKRTVKARLRTRQSRERSKTDSIASLFLEDPMAVLSPKEISVKLGMDLRVVTTIVNRLKDEGSLERVGWGRYRLKRGIVLDEETVQAILEDMRIMSSEVLGRVDEGHTEYEDGLTRVLSFYEKVRMVGGEPFALNLLRVCAKKRLDDDGVKAMVRIASEGG